MVLGSTDGLAMYTTPTADCDGWSIEISSTTWLPTENEVHVWLMAMTPGATCDSGIPASSFLQYGVGTTILALSGGVDGEPMPTGSVAGTWNPAIGGGNYCAVFETFTTFLTDAPFTWSYVDYMQFSPSCGPTCGNGVLEEGEVCDDGNAIDGDGCASDCTEEPLPSGEGCTPGYWKQTQHFDSWPDPYLPRPFAAVFEDAFPGMTLRMSARGGGLNARAHTVAAVERRLGHGLRNELRRDRRFQRRLPDRTPATRRRRTSSPPRTNQAAPSISLPALRAPGSVRIRTSVLTRVARILRVRDSDLLSSPRVARILRVLDSDLLSSPRRRAHAHAHRRDPGAHFSLQKCTKRPMIFERGGEVRAGIRPGGGGRMVYCFTGGSCAGGSQSVSFSRCFRSAARPSRASFPPRNRATDPPNPNV